MDPTLDKRDAAIRDAIITLTKRTVEELEFLNERVRCLSRICRELTEVVRPPHQSEAFRMSGVDTAWSEFGDHALRAYERAVDSLRTKEVVETKSDS